MDAAPDLHLSCFAFCSGAALGNTPGRGRFAPASLLPTPRRAPLRHVRCADGAHCAKLRASLLCTLALSSLSWRVQCGGLAHSRIGSCWRCLAGSVGAGSLARRQPRGCPLQPGSYPRRPQSSTSILLLKISLRSAASRWGNIGPAFCTAKQHNASCGGRTSAFSDRPQ